MKEKATSVPADSLPPIDVVNVSSSNVRAIGYDFATRTARVVFKGGGVYRYVGVPAELFESVRTSKSVGADVRKLYAFQTIREEASK